MLDSTPRHLPNIGHGPRMKPDVVLRRVLKVGEGRRFALLALILVLPALAGCASKHPGPSTVQPPAAITLPPGIGLQGAATVSRTATELAFAWNGTLDPPTVPGDGRGSAVDLGLDLPGTHPLLLLANAKSNAGSLSMSIRDEYGLVRCTGSEDGPCETEVAQLGWNRTWTVSLAAVDTTAPVTASLSLTVRLGPGTVVAAKSPAGLDKIQPFEAKAEDGVTLRGDVYVPKGVGPFGTVLEFSVYFNGGASTASADQAIEVDGRKTIAWPSSIDDGPLGALLDSGFAVAMVNLRGTGFSDGCQTWFDIQRDGHDAAAVIAALAKEPWSNGNVGMVGISWHGYSQYAALVDQPPALKAIAPGSAILDPWTLWTRNGAVLNANPTGAPDLAYFYADETLDNGGYLAPGQNVGSAGYVEHLGDITRRNTSPCPDEAAQLAAWETLAETGDDSAFLQARAAAPVLAKNKVPAFVTNGLVRYPGEGHIAQIDGLWPLLAPGSELLVGQWQHQFPSAAGVDRYERMLVDWFDHYLRNGPDETHPGVLYQDDASEWHEAGTWPPLGTMQTLWLSDGTLAADASAVKPAQATFEAAPATQSTPTGCPFQAAYVTPPLAQPLDLAGNLRVNVTVSSTAPDANFAVYLWSTDKRVPCGPNSSVHQVTRAISDLRHRGDQRVGQPFPVGQPAAINLASQPFASHVPAGQRLVLTITGDAGSEVARKPAIAQLTIHSDGTSSVALPVTAGTLAFAPG
jgi:predicted acyl esterase